MPGTMTVHVAVRLTSRDFAVRSRRNDGSAPVKVSQRNAARPIARKMRNVDSALIRVTVRRPSTPPPVAPRIHNNYFEESPLIGRGISCATILPLMRLVADERDPIGTKRPISGHWLRNYERSPRFEPSYYCNSRNEPM